MRRASPRSRATPETEALEYLFHQILSMPTDDRPRRWRYRDIHHLQHALQRAVLAVQTMHDRDGAIQPRYNFHPVAPVQAIVLERQQRAGTRGQVGTTRSSAGVRLEGRAVV